MASLNNSETGIIVSKIYYLLLFLNFNLIIQTLYFLYCDKIQSFVFHRCTYLQLNGVNINSQHRDRRSAKGYLDV